MCVSCVLCKYSSFGCLPTHLCVITQYIHNAHTTHTHTVQTDHRSLATLHANLADAYKDSDAVLNAVSEYTQAAEYVRACSVLCCVVLLTPKLCCVALRCVSRPYLPHIRLEGSDRTAHVTCNLFFALQTACYWQHPLYNVNTLWQTAMQWQNRGECFCAVDA